MPVAVSRARFGCDSSSRRHAEQPRAEKVIIVCRKTMLHHESSVAIRRSHWRSSQSTKLALNVKLNCVELRRQLGSASCDFITFHVATEINISSSGYYTIKNEMHVASTSVSPYAICSLNPAFVLHPIVRRAINRSRSRENILLRIVILKILFARSTRCNNDSLVFVTPMWAPQSHKNELRARWIWVALCTRGHSIKSSMNRFHRMHCRV